MASRPRWTNGTTMIQDADCKHSTNLIDYGECKHGTYVNVVVLGFHRGDNSFIGDIGDTRRVGDPLQPAPRSLETLSSRVQGNGSD